jgi:glutaredoxin
MRPTCPFCHKVITAAEELGITLDYKNITEPSVAEELVQRGGKQQVPYLVDSANKVEMYESGDIIEYLCTLSPS